jgi:uncharacterized 2Fe-2S/4Fe-4S cluster protein (DUF4445 family)
MGTCINHPERETSYLCMKHNIYLCEECLECRDPNIYCKFRSSCPIWFMSRRNRGLDAEPTPAADRPTVTFLPGGKRVDVEAGADLLAASQAADVHLNASCNGRGSCGKCKLEIVSGEVDRRPTPLLSEAETAKGTVLACQTRVTGDVTVRIPDAALQRRLKIAGMGAEVTQQLKDRVFEIDPMRKQIPLELSPPSLQDSVSDLDRLLRGLKKAGCDAPCFNVGVTLMRQLAEAVRQDNWKVTAAVIRRDCGNELLAIRPGNGTARTLGLAVDVGTTTVVVYLVDMADGSVLAAASGHNRQADCGDDVINRIVCAEKDGVAKLSRQVLTTINVLVGEALSSANADADEVTDIVVSGNTTMVHLLLKIEPRYIRREPYIPCVSSFPILKAGEVGLKADPAAAVFFMPGPASYVGGDIVAGVLSAGFHRETPLTLFIDIGTNGEIVLGNQDWLMTAACSAGPAFEGGGIRWGMRAEAGAIEKVVIDPRTLDPQLTTVADAPARGICGSGMIDLISELLETGIVDRSGRFRSDREHPRIVTINEEPAYVLVAADQTPIEADIVFTASDLKNLIYSKGAVYAGFTTLLSEAGMDFSMVDRILIAGGFGQYLDIEKAIRIGLLPDIERSKFSYLGNSAIVGAYLALLSGSVRREAVSVGNNMTYIDFSSNGRYMDAFTAAMFLPHTDLAQFPSVVISTQAPN